MKKQFFLLLFTILFQQMVVGAELSQPDTIALRVTSFTMDGDNQDELALEKKLQLFLYEDEEGHYNFVNYWAENETYSYGRVYDLKVENIEETNDTFAHQVIQFVWHFKNSYDESKGTASVVLQRILIEDMNKFTCTIKGLSKSFQLDFKGYEMDRNPD